MSYKHRLRYIAYRWFSALLFIVALVLKPAPAPSEERPQLTLRSGPGEEYAVAATVPTASRMEFTILEDHGEWVKVRVWSGQEGWLRLKILQTASRVPAADTTRPPDPAPVSVATSPSKVVSERPSEPAPLSASMASRAPAAGTDRPPDPAPVSTATPPAIPDRPPEPALSSTSTPLVQETTGRLPEQRTALVIGNAAYERELGDLQNPVNDAEDIATTLRQLSFQVTLLRNATSEQMEEALRAFHDQLRRQHGVGLFYFAGHGAELDGIGYLIPLRSGIRDRWQLPYKALNIRYVQTAMEEAGNRLNIIILDACRDIPVFEASDRKLRGKGSSPRGGLPATTAGPDMLIAYATSPGQTALDGGENDRNGIYTKHLLRTITAPGMSAEDVFREVRRGVLEETGGKQRPWESVSLTERFEFFPLSSKPSMLLPVRSQHMK